MALDTAAKRFSIGTGIVRPDGTLDAADRATLAGFYYVVDISAPPTSLRYRVSGREPARAFSARRNPTSFSGREPATTASGRIHGENP